LAKPPEFERPLPTKEEILAYIARERAAALKAGRPFPDKIGKREIGQAFGVKGAAKIELKRMLKELEGEGAVERRGKVLHRPGQLPAVVLADIKSRDRDGELIALPVEWNEDSNGPAPRIAVWAPRKPKPGQAIAGVGDRALLRVDRDEDAEKGAPEYRGRIIKLIERTRAQIVGVFRALPQGGGRLLPIDKKSLNRELIIPPGEEANARDGDLVAVDMLRAGRLAGEPETRPPGALAQAQKSLSGWAQSTTRKQSR